MLYGYLLPGLYYCNRSYTSRGSPFNTIPCFLRLNYDLDFISADLHVYLLFHLDKKETVSLNKGYFAC